MRPVDSEDIKNRHTYHDVPHRVRDFEAIRGAARVLAEIIKKACPETWEHNQAHARLEEAVMWANAAIARHSSPPAESSHDVTNYEGMSEHDGAGR